MNRLHLVILLLGTGCSASTPALEQTAQPFLNLAADVEFVGDDACFACHETEYTGFQDHGMANSFYPLSGENVVEEFPSAVLRDQAAGYLYRAIEEDGRFYQEETLRAADGKVIHRLLREMKFVMGSGTAARTYFDMSQGSIYELPLTWYTQRGKWDFSPGYRGANKRFERRAPDRCVACHNSYPEVEPHANGKFLSAPTSIGCERCHGPGSLHVSERLAVPEAAGLVDSTIVNPAHLTLPRRLDVCQQCHLSATVSILKEGKGPFDFRPSHSLQEYLTLYVAAETGSTGEISVISHADRMQQSACFIESVAAGASFECTTCHDPHGGFRARGNGYFNETCLNCHGPQSLADLAPAHESTDNCINCHMPRVEAEEAPHSSFTDHQIRVITASDDTRGPAPSPAEDLTPYFPADASPVHEGMAYVVLGRQRADQSLLEKGARLLDLAASEGPIQGEAHFLRGFARLESGRPQDAIAGLEAAVAADDQIPERLNALAQAYEATSASPVRIEQLYASAVQIQPARAEIWINYGRFMESRTRIDEAIQAYQRAAQEQPWLAKAHYNLGTALARNGNFDAALTALKAAIALEPKNPQTWGNLGTVYGEMGQPDSVGYAFERAVTMAPESALALGNLGAFYLNQDRFKEAIQLLDRATVADPAFADALANRALAHLRLGERASARLYARRALSAQGGHALALQILKALE